VTTQYCRDCYRNLPEADWKPTYWGDTSKTCRRCTNDYKRATRNPVYEAQRKALKASVRRAIRNEKAALRVEVLAVRKQVRDDTREARYAETTFRRCARDLGLDP